LHFPACWRNARTIETIDSIGSRVFCHFAVFAITSSNLTAPTILLEASGFLWRIFLRKI